MLTFPTWPGPVRDFVLNEPPPGEQVTGKINKAPGLGIEMNRDFLEANLIEIA